jgi:hypothetical protein
VAICALAAASVGCGSATADPDPATYARPVAVDGTNLQFQLPSGGFTLVVGDPVTTIPAGETADGEALEAPEDERFVPVTDIRADGNNLDSLIGPTFSDYPDASVELLVDDRSYPISEDTSVLESYIRVKADADSRLGAAVTFDGVRQVVWADGEQDAGEAEVLYGYPATASIARCDDGWMAAPGSPKVTFEVKRFADSGCTFKAVEYPYVVGEGWAFEESRDSTWGIVESTLRIAKASVQVGGTMRECDEIRPGKALVTVDGEPLVKAMLKDTTAKGGPAALQRNVFLVDETAEHSLRIEASFPCVVGRETHRIGLVWAKQVAFTTSSTAH